MGGIIYRLPRFTGTNIARYKMLCNAFFKENHHYIAVHVHIGSCAALVISSAKQYKLFTIAHSHNTNPPISLSSAAFKIASFPTRYLADYYLACSEQAGIDRFGKKTISKNNFSVLKNGIDLQNYRFDKRRRTIVRDRLGISQETYVVGHVGRFCLQKNHSFLIEVFSEIAKRESNSVLLLFGRGPLENSVRSLAQSLHLESKVIFGGISSDISSDLMAMDVFVFPSVYEGFGIAAVEAQATGLPCILSSSLPRISSAVPNAKVLPLKDGPSSWAQEAIESMHAGRDETERPIVELKDAGFDISDSAVRLEKLYFEHR